MTNYYISINQLVEFAFATEAQKRTIIKQQLKPNKFLIPWYQGAKSSIRRYLQDPSTPSAINEGIQKLKAKIPTKQRQVIDIRVSTEALQRTLQISVPPALAKYSYEIVTPIEKTISLNGVDVIVAPDLIIKGERNGKVVYGAVKIHISKTKPFSQIQSQCVSTLLLRYLEKKVIAPGETALPELCISLDVFADRIASASESHAKEIADMKKACLEVKKIWGQL